MYWLSKAITKYIINLCNFVLLNFKLQDWLLWHINKGNNFKIWISLQTLFYVSIWSCMCLYKIYTYVSVMSLNSLQKLNISFLTFIDWSFFSLCCHCTYGHQLFLVLPRIKDEWSMVLMVVNFPNQITMSF